MSLARTTTFLALLFVAATLVEGNSLFAGHRRSLKGCKAISIAVRGQTSQEEEAIAEAVSKAIASSKGCSNVDANSRASAEAIATATATAIAKTKTQVTGTDCDNAFAKAKARAEGFASVLAKTVATAFASAYNDQQDVVSFGRAGDIEEDIKSAVAQASSSTIGAGEDISVSFAKVMAEATAKSVSTAVAKVECEGGTSTLPPTSATDSSTAVAEAGGDPCACSNSDTAGDVYTGSPGCGQHALAVDPTDDGYFCYAVGGSNCSTAKSSNAYPGAYWITCSP